MNREVGTIKWFGGYNAKLGKENDFGFIAQVGKDDVYVHLKSLLCPPAQLTEGTPVTFEIVTKPQSRNGSSGKPRLSAAKVQLLRDETNLEVIEFYSSSDDEAIWLEVIGKYLAALSLEEALPVAVTKLALLDKPKTSSAKRNQLARQIPPQMFVLPEAKYLRGLLSNRERIQICVDILHQVANDKSEPAIFNEIWECIDREPVSSRTGFWEMVPDRFYRYDPRRRKLLSPEMHYKSLLTLWEENPEAVPVEELKSVIQKLASTKISTFWKSLPNEILLLPDVFEMAPYQVKMEALCRQFEATKDESIIESVARFMSDCPDYTRFSLPFPIPEAIRLHPRVFNLMTPQKQVEAIWERVTQNQALSVWKQLSEAAKILCVHRVAKEGGSLPYKEIREIPEENLLVRAALNLLWAKDKSAKTKGETFEKCHGYVQEHIVNLALQSLDPILPVGVLPDCHPGVLSFCEGKPWPISERPLPKNGKESRAFCRGGKGCQVLWQQAPNCSRKGARLYPETALDWENWSFFELLEKAGIEPKLDDNQLAYSREYIPKMAGWVNRLNEIRSRLKCSVCQGVLTPNLGYSKNLAYYNMTRASCKAAWDHDTNIYFSHCWACGKTIDSRESRIQVGGYYICIGCGSGERNSKDFAQGDICPKCGAKHMKVDLDIWDAECGNCSHTIRLPAAQNLTGRLAKKRT